MVAESGGSGNMRKGWISTSPRLVRGSREGLFQRPPFDLPYPTFGVVGSKAEGSGELDFAGPEGEGTAGDGDVDDLLFIDPGTDVSGRDLEAEGIPAAGIEVVIGTGLVVGGVPAIDAGDADDVASPASGDPGAESAADGEGEGGEEIATLFSLGFETDFVVLLEGGIGVGDAGERGSWRQDEVAVFDTRCALASEWSLTPWGEGFAIKQGLPGLGGERDGEECEKQEHDWEDSMIVIGSPWEGSRGCGGGLRPMQATSCDGLHHISR